MLMNPYLLALYTILAVAVGAWVYSVLRENVSVVDSLWSLFFLLAAIVFAASAPTLTVRGALVVALVAVWALRLSIYIAARNFGEDEDYRYRTIRSNNEPGFAFKSLYIVFGLQGLLAWLIALPLLPAITVDAPLGVIDAVALGLCLSASSSKPAATTSCRGSGKTRKIAVRFSIPVCGDSRDTPTTSAISASGGPTTCLPCRPADGGA